MLVDVTFTDRDPILTMIAETNGRSSGNVRVREGVYLSGHWSFNLEIVEKMNEYPEFSPITAECSQDLHARHPNKYDEYTGPSPEVLKELHRFDPEEDEWGELGYMGTYGVVDSVEQLLSLYDFEADPRKLVISMVSINREDQPSDGGWRYHKWGTYYGTQKPVYEYLYQDKHIDEVFTFHVYEVL